VKVIAAIGLILLAVACSGNGTDSNRLLSGVQSSTARELCAQYAELRADDDAARRAVQPMDEIAKSYTSLAVNAKNTNAKRFGAVLDGLASDVIANQSGASTSSSQEEDTDTPSNNAPLARGLQARRELDASCAAVGMPINGG
jgi:hypothetical protein